ncbi:2-keto-4-pentenoate hydratase/2-oxohepta-3-ene-1,7-dioic acid hydratase in catechol pathway [Pseudomonas frederiksbergensis]|jgi:2-keto-4-pentenoate hydratase/2-oxohepta-3-ene-1,7-dioic acid hydratase in catechol pathway|uniref:2-keto-4-pentenoate hydratase/2-oxohepta-3-ene-1,7-dioic acid hydratase in catechol pathway n=1 Tax=Pseudomonas umsongensis TaxID=198618 RepID=A0ACC5MC81_9PSED|nr:MULTISPECIES: fumarylacetoacetate hydrolase family protein [Pseudomonas]MBB2886323.1 2-keto-4-pentenoate hydratase/2-oxohepta-3-ene-1,7-dioic acid hydratase in catechol pathway [Pseudomonas umsongensis]MBD9615977.1 fumarylacetoacetate hydrolase family protein [Pseudomonas sp. PDM07]NMN75289.1 2-keto-4-pentenoate hydratase/2-oxohepta-3-ene-1,7-dioic acid hydratase in catechol pathway [Pseudomonas sp. KD5]PZW64724.1 2-keto-4-pentenoate hydratase/2-oxohepta-3-ene-1,7-dioic acid hydratase in cat
MKLASFIVQGRSTYGVVDGEHVIDLESVKQTFGTDLKQAIANNRLAELSHEVLASQPRIPLAEVTFLPVIPNPGKVLCIGINYATHVRETGREMPTYPMIFTRFADSQTAHLQPIVRPKASHKLDFEGELAVVIGKPARHVKQADALDYVAGYACYNDGSVRDWQKHTIQFVPGKNFPNTGGFGPWLVTRDEIGDPQDLELTTRLNGEVMQHTSTSDMIFDVRALIEYCSTFTELAPGDVIVSGTTGGVGAFREPPVWMKPGDEVEIEISRIGILRNSIVDEQ